MRSFGSAFAALLVSAAVDPAAHGQPPPSGPEFQVNAYSTYAQTRPDASIDGDGDFVVVWTSEKQDGDLDGVFARRFNSSGAAQGAEFQVSLVTAGVQNEANVAVQANGAFVVVWRSGPDTASGEIFARRFSSSGTALGSPFQVNTYDTDLQHQPAVAVDGDGNFLVAWNSEGQDGSTGAVAGRNGGVFARRFDSAGVAQSVELQINTYTPNGQHDPVIGMRADGFFVVTWASLAQDEETTPGTPDGVFAQRFTSAGAPLGVEFQVNTYTTNYQHHQSIGMDAEGDFVIVWHSAQIELPSDIFGQRFASSGTPLGGEFQINTFTQSAQEDTAVAMEEDGDFVVVWDSRTQDGDAYGVFGKRFDSAGTALSNDFQINTFTASYQNRPAATRSTDGKFVVVWQSSAAQDGYGYGVFAKRFGTSSGPVLDVDGNGVIGALTDGILVLRWAFGFEGTTLESGAIGANCMRCDGGEVKAYLDPLRTQLDIDGNGSTSALTDGILALRALFGFTGNTLIGGATAGNCTRCTAEDIEAYIATLKV